MSKTNILIVNDHLGWDNQIHGAARLFLQWATHLDSDKFNVSVCILRKKNSLSKPFEEKGINITFLGKGKYNPKTLFDLIRIIREGNFHVLHLQSYGATTFGRVAKLFTKTPIIVHFHDTTPYYPFVQHLSDRLLKKLTDKYLAVSDSARKVWAKRHAIDPSEVLVLNNCAPIKDFQPLNSQEKEAEKERLGISSGNKIVGSLTRLFPEKGTKYLLQAIPMVLKDFPNTSFVIIGDGPIRDELVTLTEQLGIQNNVKFTGFTDNVAQILGTFDIKVLTSYAVEGCPVSVLEAMAMEKAIIVTDIIDTIQDGVTGLVIPPKKPKILAEKIIYLLKDESEARRLAQNARKMSKEYDVSNYIRKLEQIYESLSSK